MSGRLAIVPQPAHAGDSVLHVRLADFNARRLRPAFVAGGWSDELHHEFTARLEEGRFVEYERSEVAPLLGDLPTDADAFVQWFEFLRSNGPGQNDALFPWLAASADLGQMRWFLQQEIAGEAGFDDLVALTQVRFPPQPKLEMARNYWDEMGRGHEAGMHGGMLARTARELDIDANNATTVWESLALANLMAALATNRRYAYQSVGALGVIEMTAPDRVAQVNDGLRRLGVSAGGRMYFQRHAGVDRRHSEAWNREIIRPLVAADPRAAIAIAEGALMRLRAGERCFERYRSELGVP